MDKNAENLKLIRELIKSKVTNDEKVSLARILASFHSYDDAAGFNSGIRTDLKDLLYSGNAEVGRSAVLAYSRLGYFSDSEQLLTFAKTSGYIDNQSYYGDLAYLLINAPQDAQERIIGNIRSGQNKFSADVLASITQDQELLKKFSPSALGSIKSFLNENEPKFPDSTSQFGLIDAIRYTEWLNSVAALNGAAAGPSYSQFVTAQLNKDTVDPRNIFSVFISQDSRRFIDDLAQSGALGKMRERMVVYAGQNPSNITIQDSLVEIDSKIKSALAKKHN